MPLYKKPNDLVTVQLGDFNNALKGEQITGRLWANKLVPYAKRAEIESGALSGKGLELVWVDDPVDAFFLQIQGSGLVKLPSGKFYAWDMRAKMDSRILQSAGISCSRRIEDGKRVFAGHSCLAGGQSH